MFRNEVNEITSDSFKPVNVRALHLCNNNIIIIKRWRVGEVEW